MNRKELSKIIEELNEIPDITDKYKLKPPFKYYFTLIFSNCFFDFIFGFIGFGVFTIIFLKIFKGIDQNGMTLSNFLIFAFITAFVATLNILINLHLYKEYSKNYNVKLRSFVISVVVMFAIPLYPTLLVIFSD